MVKDEKPVVVEATKQPFPKAKGGKDVPVTPLSRRNGLVMVEWSDNGRLFRHWIKEDSVRQTPGGSVATDPSHGVPYGFDWSVVVKLQVTPEMIDTELKRIGIWTAEDLRSRAAEARSAILAAYGFDVASLLEAVRKWEQENSASPATS